MKRILVATDGSEGAARAIAFAADLAKQLGASLSIITVSGDFSENDVRQLARSEGGIGAALDLLSNRILVEAKEQAQRIGITNIETQAAWGDAAGAIIDAAVRIQADAVVLGRRGRGQLAGLLLGSVSQKVATLAPCTVIVVP
ncbi:MAG: universal stress protein [Methylovirgula sp.]